MINPPHERKALSKYEKHQKGQCHSPHLRRINLHPHLHPHHHNPIPQQDPRIRPPPPYIQTHTRERISARERHKQRIPYAWGVDIIFCEQPRSRTGGVKSVRDVGALDVGQGVGVGGAGGGGWGVGFDLFRGS